MAQDIIDIKTKPAILIKDHYMLKTFEKDGMRVDRFALHGRIVAKVTFKDADVYDKQSYGKLQTAKALDAQMDARLKQRHSLEEEQRVATQILLCTGGQTGGRTSNFWGRRRDLAQRALSYGVNLDFDDYLDIIDASYYDHDNAFLEMSEIVKMGLPQEAFNPYEQAIRDWFAVREGRLYNIKGAHIVMVLGKSDNFIAFVLSNIFKKLSTKAVENDVAESLDKFSSLSPVPVPDTTTKEDLDFTAQVIDRPPPAKSGLYRLRYEHDGSGSPKETRDSIRHQGELGCLVQDELLKLKSQTLSVCSDVVQFLFNLLDPTLLEEYKDVYQETSSGSYDFLPGDYRQVREYFAMKKVMVNMMPGDHTDKGSWHHGLTATISIGDYQGGDLLSLELGLQIQTLPGSVQLLRGGELGHSTTICTGNRFDVVGLTHEGIRRTMREQVDDPIDDGSTVSECGSPYGLEDVVPEDMYIRPRPSQSESEASKDSVS